MPAKQKKRPKKAPRKQAKASGRKRFPKAPAPAERRKQPSSNGSSLCHACGSDNVIVSRERGETFCKDCQEIFAELDPEDEQKYERASGVI